MSINQFTSLINCIFAQNEWPATDWHCTLNYEHCARTLINGKIVGMNVITVTNSIYLHLHLHTNTVNTTQKRVIDNLMWMVLLASFCSTSKVTMNLSSPITVLLPERYFFLQCIKIRFLWFVFIYIQLKVQRNAN